jgi:hypothetical protein
MERTNLRQGQVERQIVRPRQGRSSFKNGTGFPKGRPGYVIDHIVPLAWSRSSLEHAVADEGSGQGEGQMRVMSSMCDGLSSLRLLPRLLRIFCQKPLASSAASEERRSVEDDARRLPPSVAERILERRWSRKSSEPSLTRGRPGPPIVFV